MTRHDAIRLSVLLACTAPCPALAQSLPYMQDYSVTGFDTTVTIVRLPIKTAGGKFVFKDVTVTLSSTDDQGTLKSTAKVVQANSPMLNTSTIVAGQYARSDAPSDQFLVSGPGPLADGGEAKWTIVAAAGSYPCGAPSTFYTGPLKGNPLYTRLQAAAINSPEYNYGIIDAGSTCTGSYSSGGIIGVAQIGSQIEVATFTSNGQDQSTPISRLLYNAVQ